MALPSWYTKARTLCPVLEPCESGEHGFHSLRHPNGRALSDADLFGSEVVVGAVLADGRDGPAFHAVGDAVAWIEDRPAVRAVVS